MPLLILSFAYIFSLNEMMIAILVLFASTPTAPSAFVLARQLGGDLKLMSAVISVQTLISILTMSIILNYFIT
jgi:predicted permease